MKTQSRNYHSKVLSPLSSTSLLLYALMFALFVLAVATRSAAQDIYMSSKYAPESWNSTYMPVQDWVRDLGIVQVFAQIGL